MTRGIPSRPVLSATLVLMLLASISVTAFSAPVSAEPSQETASSSVTVSHSAIIDDGPSGRFGYSVLGQATSVFKAITAPASQTQASFTQGIPTTFQITVAGLTGAATGGPLMIDVVWPNFTVISATPTAGCPRTTSRRTGASRCWRAAPHPPTSA